MIIGVAAGLLVVLLVGFGLTLRHSQANSRDDLVQRFADSNDNSASLTGALFGSTTGSSAKDLTETMGGDSVSQATIDSRVEQGNAPYGVVVDEKGHVVAASSDAPAGSVANIAKLPEYVRAAFGPQSFGLSDSLSGPDGARVIEFALGYNTAHGGRRVFISATDPSLLTSFLGGYLNKTRRLKGSDAYIVDSNGVVIASTAGASPAGEPVADSELRRRSLADDSGGYGNDREFAAAQVEGTGWRTVTTAPSGELLANVRGANKWVPWLLFAAFAIAAFVALAFVRRALQGADRIKHANERLESSNTQLEQRAKELQRSNEELEQFASIASHDLKEPLRKVQMFSKQLQEREGEQLSATGNDYIDRMVNASDRMENLIEDLLVYSRVSTRGVDFAPVDLNEVFRECVADLDALITETGADIEIGDLPVVPADHLQMRQLAQNLVSNGVKFHRDGVTPKVTISGEVVAGKARIVVADNGIGFDQRYAMRIFGVFERLQGRNVFPGTGIGLAICRKIAQRHGGEISAEGKVGEGATFTVTIPTRPVASAHQNGNPVHTEQAKEAAHAGTN